MTKKKKAVKYVPRPLLRPKRLTVFTGFICLFSTGIFAFALLDDVHLAGGHDFFAKTAGTRAITTILGAAATCVAFKMIGLSCNRPKILETTLGVVALGLGIQVPVMFAFHPGMGWFLVVVLAVTFLAFLLAGTKRVQDDLRRFGSDARFAPPVASNKSTDHPNGRRV